MINLIPPAGHRALKQEYFLRVGATMGFLTTGVFLFLTVSLIPIYVLTRAQIQNFTFEIEKNNSSDELFKKAERDVSVIESVLKQLKTSPTAVPASEAIAEIQNNAPASIIFKAFRLQSPNETTASIYVQGIAPTREVLAQFIDNLEATRMFEKAEVPISDLARESNLPFAMQVTFATK